MIGFDDVVEIMAVSSAVTSIGAALAALFQRGRSAEMAVEVKIDGKPVDLDGVSPGNVDEMIEKIKGQLIKDHPGSKSVVSHSDMAG